jgi:long-chain acyl-CoA synthetase
MSESLVSRLLAHASARPGDAAIVDAWQTLTYGELARRILGAAARLDALGVRPGDTVALSFGARIDTRDANVAEFTSVLYAAGYIGAAVVPLYPDVPQARRRELIGSLGARWSIASGQEDLGARSLVLGEICDEHRSAPPHVPSGCAAGVPFFYQFSSGTTGAPKAVLFSHRQFLDLAVALVGRYGWKPSDRLLPAVRAPAKAGLRYLFRVLLAGGALLNLQFPDTRRQLSEMLDAFGATAAGASPWQLRRLLASEPAAQAAPQLGFLESIGAPISAAEIEAVRRALTPHLHVNYSSTESGLIATLGPGDAADGGYAPIEGMEVQVVDHAEAPLPAGTVGAIRVRAPWIPAGYARNAAETAKRFRGGWFHPGDEGAIDRAGRLFPRGRSDGAINYGGAKIIPEEVEAVLLAHPGVSDALVLGIPDAMAGEIPVAFVVLSAPATLAALKPWCEARLNALSRPVSILSVEGLRSADGKAERSRLKEHASSLSHMFHSTKP